MVNVVYVGNVLIWFVVVGPVGKDWVIVHIHPSTLSSVENAKVS